jgi:anhydro-N-acetylmuramic acid kinase
MSGTSCDGIDAAAVRVSDRARGLDLHILAHLTVPYPSWLRQKLLRLADCRSGRVDQVSQVSFVLGELFASAAREVVRAGGMALDQVTAICSHGHTVWHQPSPAAVGEYQVRSTLQIGEPAVIAERTGVLTIANFRTRDVAAGGLGAPLVPYADWLLFSHEKLHRVVQNIGGIANLTYLPAGGEPEQVLAFDTGPGNMLIDEVASVTSGGAECMDRGGEGAGRGRVDPALLERLLAHPFLSEEPPKATGRELFGAHFVEMMCRGCPGIGRDDLLATVTEFTARSIAGSYRQFLPGPVDQVILGGGGVHNRQLVHRLQRLLAPAAVLTHDDFGIPSDAKEAVAFAILGHETLSLRPGNLPGATGARRRVILGQLVWP